MEVSGGLVEFKLRHFVADVGKGEAEKRRRAEVKGLGGEQSVLAEYIAAIRAMRDDPTVDDPRRGFYGSFSREAFADWIAVRYEFQTTFQMANEFARFGFAHLDNNGKTRLNIPARPFGRHQKHHRRVSSAPKKKKKLSFMPASPHQLATEHLQNRKTSPCQNSVSTPAPSHQTPHIPLLILANFPSRQHLQTPLQSFSINTIQRLHKIRPSSLDTLDQPPDFELEKLALVEEVAECGVLLGLCGGAGLC